MGTEGQEDQPRYGTINFEKRKHPRFSLDLPVEYYKLGSMVKHDGKAMNASQSGLLLYFSEPPQIGQYLRLKLFLPSDSKLKVIKMIAVVVWMDTIPPKTDWGEYRIGVKFVDISAEDMTGLENFLRRLAR